jgi:DNA-directed RNA polymerase specialized sigma24 family protein
MSGSLLFLRREHRPAADVSDERLVALCESGNAAALDLLFRRHGDRVYRFLARLPAIDGGDLEELVKKTFVEAYRGAATHAVGMAVSVWLVGIAVKVARRYTRARAGSPALPAVGEAAPSSSRRAGGSSGSRLGSALADLPQELQLAFALCDLEEIKGSEVARILGVSEAALWRNVHEARGRLQRAFAPLVAEGAL